MQETHVNSNGAKIWTASQGQGIPLILCNGGPGCCDYLGPVADMVDDLAQVIRFEQRGCGRSDCTPPYDIETTIDDLENIRRHYGIERWVIGGHSYGPDLALAYTFRHPDRVLGLIAISGGIIYKGRGWSEEYHRRLEKEGEQNPEMLYPYNLEVNAAVSGTWHQFVLEPSLLRFFADFQPPALFVYGSEDIRPRWPVEQLVNLLPNAQLVVIPGAAHVIWMTHGKELPEALRGFLSKIPSPQAVLG